MEGKKLIVLGVIPARKGSERLPNKNILSLCGKPLIAYTIEAALKAKRLDRVIVSTDGEEIAQVARQYGAEVISRPAEISTSTAPIDEALRHAVSYLESTEGYKADVVVLMQANIPIRDVGGIDGAVEKLIECGADAVATAYEVNQRPEWMKHLIDDRAVPYMPPSKLYRMQDFEKLYLIDGAVTAIRVDTLMRTRGDTRVHAYMGQNVRLVLQDRIYTIEVDSQDDLWLAECLLRGMHLQSREDDA